MESWGTYELSLEELEAMPTLIEGQADDCKIKSDTERVWLSRCTVEDGEPWDNKVTVERYIGGSWIEVEWWEAESDGSSLDNEFGPYDKFTLTIDLGNDAMSTVEDLASALRSVAAKVTGGGPLRNGAVMDDNGNTVGKYELTT